MSKGRGLIVTTSPHVRDEDSVTKIMYNVVLALLPALILAVRTFGLHALWLIITCSVTALASEALAQKLRGVKVTINDGSALVTALLLAMSLPPNLPLWVAVVGTVVAIILGKQIFGGLGYNYFNPALIGRAFLLASFPVLMTTWEKPFVDAQAQATPLGLMKMEGVATPYSDLFMGSVSGSLGEVSALAILIGGLYLLYKGYIDWRIPLSYLGTVVIFMTILGEDPIFHLLAGSLLAGAFFYATDMVTTPITKKGRWIFGIGAGILLVLIRIFGGYPEGVLYSIILMNMFVPIIDKYTVPTVFGEVAK
ncbi:MULTISPECIES: RnfABCDGE type electron transport complex subunit D [unclassified Candidatus Frackibacter]|uniref:RnfABCDGE type electron transport complex subunit D n=1 Tax=unclassified Candidatus Frackibacter TaxID=2648818 RepID=UPI0007954DB8|nr:MULTISPECIES: RnfABCDGE type electron transport complex subunit D [unclassified Candidatus Frackibacter]KXS37605.1 MAG: electron transport complex protein RnfD [Candidatus Frackibacter sp. T328-2]SDC41782.1 electron transport complex protein RnfD [Candidatus Frackibacter sp. WG11]SEM59240.1 electron transport complex protein RnfD [Candidatus Frackibacter sp. WG12]SFL62854.1 electron transport complex protein RnfD [Candidatus Frackibacter sp. WG13]